MERQDRWSVEDGGQKIGISQIGQMVGQVAETDQMIGKDKSGDGERLDSKDRPDSGDRRGGWR